MQISYLEIFRNILYLTLVEVYSSMTENPPRPLLFMSSGTYVIHFTLYSRAIYFLALFLAVLPHEPQLHHHWSPHGTWLKSLSVSSGSRWFVQHSLVTGILVLWRWNMRYVGWDTEVLPGSGPFFEWAMMVCHYLRVSTRILGWKSTCILFWFNLFSLSFFLWTIALYPLRTGQGLSSITWKVTENLWKIMFPFAILYYCTNLFKELHQVTEFSPADTLLPQAYHVNLPLIRSFIPFSGTDGRLRAVKYLGSPERPEKHPPRSSNPSQIQSSIPVSPVEAFCECPFKGNVDILSAACGVRQAHFGLTVFPCLLPPPSSSMYLSSCMEVMGWAALLSCKDFWSCDGFWLSSSAHHILFNLLLGY